MRNCMLAAIIAGVLLTGCVSIEIGPEDSPMRLEWEGLGTAYAAMNGMPEWDGKVASAHLLRGDEGELAAVEIWPVAEVAVGLLGAKIHLLPFEVGAGILAYEPEPEEYGWFDDDGDDDDDDEDDDDEDDDDEDDDDKDDDDDDDR